MGGGMSGGRIAGPHGGEDEVAASRRFEDRFGVFWTIIIYIMAGVGLYGLSQERPDLLRETAGLVPLALLAAHFVLFHVAFLRGPAQPSPRRLALYGTVQLLIIVALQRYSPNFGNLGIALLSQIITALPPRQWPLPFAAITIAIGAAWGGVAHVRSGDWRALAFLFLQLLVWMGIFGSVTLLQQQRHRLARLVEELRRAREELRARAAQAEELAVLRERTRLAREMHDSLGHALVAVNVKLEAAERLYTRDAERGAGELRATRALVREAMVELRRSLDDLRGPLPRDRDLPASLRLLAEDSRARGRLAVHCDIADDLPHLAAEVATALGQVAREALVNVERHAAAGNVAITLEHAAALVTLRIADDGAGIGPADLARPGHYGIQGMRERIEGLGGHFRVGARPGGGTIVAATIDPAGLVPVAPTPSPLAAREGV